MFKEYHIHIQFKYDIHRIFLNFVNILFNYDMHVATFYHKDGTTTEFTMEKLHNVEYIWDMDNETEFTHFFIFLSFWQSMREHERNNEKPSPRERRRKIHKVKRKKINKVKRDPKKDRIKEKLKNLKEEQDGYDLDYVFKSGKYMGKSIRYVINHDIPHIEILLRNGFRFNKRTFDYFAQTRKEYYDDLDRRQKEWEEAERKRKEKEERERQNRSRYYWDSTQDSYDYFRDRFSEFFTGGGHRSGRSYQQRQNFSGGYTSISQEKKFGAILGFSGQVKKSEIKGLYRKKALQWHPDKWETASQQEKEKATEKMKEINEAYDFFKNKYAL